MKFKLTASVTDDFTEIRAATKVLESNLGSEDYPSRMTMYGFYKGKGWAIDHHGTHWELRIHKRYVSKPWFTEFLLKWT